MKSTKPIFLVLLAAAAMTACNHKHHQHAQGDDATDTTQAEKPAAEKPYQVFGFQKTPCFGKCPVYQVKFFNDGNVTWTGKSNTPRMGEHWAKVDPSVLKAIREKSQEVRYFDFYEKYPLENRVADLPSTITYVRVGDMIKTVNNTHDAPEGLIVFEKYLAGVIEGLKWEKVADK